MGFTYLTWNDPREEARPHSPKFRSMLSLIALATLNGVMIIGSSIERSLFGSRKTSITMYLFLKLTMISLLSHQAGCPKELQVVGDDGGGNGGVVACKSACEAFGSDQYCCSGEYANPSTCKPSFYSTLFKKACPRAYSYAFDDGSSTFTCKANDYAIVFCPTASREREDASTSPPPPPPPPQEYTSQPPPQAYASPPPPQLIPQNHKHSNEGAKGETSSSNTLHPLSLIIFGLGAFNLWC